MKSYSFSPKLDRKQIRHQISQTILQFYDEEYIYLLQQILSYAISQSLSRNVNLICLHKALEKQKHNLKREMSIESSAISNNIPLLDAECSMH